MITSRSYSKIKGIIMLKKLISKNQNSRRLIFFHQKKKLNNQNDNINLKTLNKEKENIKTSKTETKEL